MSIQPSQKSEKRFFLGLPLLFVIAGGLFLLYSLWFWNRGVFQILPGIFTESIQVPLDYVQLGLEIFPIQVENFVLFQNYESLPPLSFPSITLLGGIISWILLVFLSTLISTFNRTPFIIGVGVWMAILSISGINSLNIGGVYSNYALIILLLGWVLPLIFINFYKSHWTLFQRFVGVFPLATLTMIGLIYFSDMPFAPLLVAENLTLPAVVLSALFLLHIGHAIFSGTTILLIRLNKGVGLKISYQLLVIFLIYFLLVFFTLLDVLGEVRLPFPVLPPYVLFLVAGSIGFFVYQEKTSQTAQPFNNPLVGKALYLAFFAMTLWTWGKVLFVDNQPYVDFFNHVFIYGQVALTLLFFLYLMANFSGILNSGKDVEKILFKPQHFAYFHMRIGSMMALVILIVFADGIIATQLTSGSTNQTADYYYQANLPKQAAILYESAWLQYRKNDKAKNAAVHLYLQDGNKREALEQLELSMDFNPNVPNILLISKILHEQDKVFEAVFYLEKGLKLFPENQYLLNNLALLQSKLNKPADAIQLLSNYREKNAVINANWIGLHVKHQRDHENLNQPTKDPLTAINQLAHANRLGNIWDGTLAIDILGTNITIQSAAIRNLWTNQPNKPLSADLGLIDSLIATTEITFRERYFRDSRVIRLYQEKNLSETLKYLVGNAGIFASSAGYYHQWSALILAGQLDLEKAAIDILVAEERGVSDFKPYHLAILYFGDRPIDAIRFHQKFGIAFPAWMVWGEDGKLTDHPQLRYFEGLRGFHSKQEAALLQDLEAINQELLKASFAAHLIIHKAHLLSSKGITALEMALIQQGSVITKTDLQDWIQYVQGTKNEIPPGNFFAEMLQPTIGLDRNPYWTPMVLKQVKDLTDEMDKYSILQDAKLFNKDPMLWITYIQQAKKLGLDSYATDALQELQGWCDTSQIARIIESSSSQ
jgi:tetratricopeptide (TPR) repeat protein